MFTGIITSVGDVVAAERRGNDLRLRIASDYAPETIEIGASIACDGVCLTVTERGGAERGAWFTADVSAETISKTTLADRAAGDRINLERALKVGDELGGHIVTGHVDGVGEIAALHDDGESLRVTVAAPQGLARFIAAKGSIAMDGVSLTVNEVEGASFGVNLIPHTRAATNFGGLRVGRRVNLEIDVLARYVARLAEAG
ncbi:riboflavin synthase [Pikeienuella sp. HZG-20]|uniref:riboflavin synthase n=1 Tax=Paludibacillus litoralis TaxID=3133267 RepID=UPI0030EDA05A